MTVKLNQAAFEQAKVLIGNRQCVLDQRDEWIDHKPARTAANRSIEKHGVAAYARWHLGDDEINEGTKGRYKYPYGDFRNVHRCAVLAAESRAGKRKYTDIELAAAHLHGMLEELTSSQHREWERRHVSSQ